MFNPLSACLLCFRRASFWLELNKKRANLIVFFIDLICIHYKILDFWNQNDGKELFKLIMMTELPFILSNQLYSSKKGPKISKADHRLSAI